MHDPWKVTLWRRIRHKLLRSLGRNETVLVERFRLEVPEDMIWLFDSNGDYYERTVTSWLVRLLDAFEAPIFYDVGANYGYYCLKCAEHAQHIYAFEPVNQTFAMLEKNINRNRLTERVSMYRLGLADREEPRIIHLYSMSCKNSLFRRSGISDRFIGTEEIELVQLDELVVREGLAEPSLIKLDIEGGELAALRGARRLRASAAPIVVLEYVASNAADAGYTLDQLLAELHVIEGTRVYWLPEDGEASDELFDVCQGDGTLIAIPKRQEALLCSRCPSMDSFLKTR